MFLSYLCSLLLRPPRPILCPYTTLFRSPPAIARGPQGQSGDLGSDREVPDAVMTGAVVPSHHGIWEDRKSTRLNSSHVAISYAVFCLKKKNNYRSIFKLTCIFLNIA